MGKKRNLIEKAIYKQRLNDIKNPKIEIPEQYLLNGFEALSLLHPYRPILKAFRDMLISKKSTDGIIVIKKTGSYRDESIDACIQYSKEKDNDYNIRRKHFILEFEDSKLSDFLIFFAGNVYNALNDISYKCYYLTTINKGYDIIIAISENIPDHCKVLEDTLKEQRMLEKFNLWGDFKKLYNFSAGFVSHVSVHGKDKENEFSAFIPRNYTFIENPEYLEYQKTLNINEIIAEAVAQAKKEFDGTDAAEPHSSAEDSTMLESQNGTTVEGIVQTSNVYTTLLPVYDHGDSVYSSIINLISLYDTTAMLSLLGFFITNAVPSLSEKQNLYSLSIITTNQEKVRKVLDVLHRIVFSESRHPSVTYHSSKLIKQYFKDSSNYLPTITTNDKFNKTDGNAFSSALTNYYNDKPNKLKDSLVILSKIEISHNRIYNINLTKNISPDFDKLIIALKSDQSLSNTIKDFLDNIKSRYSFRLQVTDDFFEVAENNAELIQRELSDKIQDLSNNYSLTYEQAVIIAPIVYFLEEYFEFLLLSHGITEAQYKSLNKKLKAIYSCDCEESEIISQTEENSEPTAEEISDILLRCIAKAYTGNKIPTTTDKDFYIYTGCTSHKELICFKHQKSSPLKYIIDMIDELKITDDKLSEIRSLALKENTGEGIKQLWKNKGILHTKDGLLYSTRKGKVLAIIPERI